MQAGEHDGLGDKVQVTVNSLQNWMSHNSHTSIEILKLDIEGAEYDVINAWARAGKFPPFRQLLIEFHWKMMRRQGNELAEQMHEEAVKGLRDAGYRVLSPAGLSNDEVSFVKIDG